MSKQASPGEAKKPAAAAAPAASAEHHAPKPGLSQPSSHKSTSAKLGCHERACKEKDVRFNFCDEHFRQFKFGLITKSGDRVVDYERKFEHYNNWLKSQKVA